MTRTIDYYLSLASPWAYLGHAVFVDLEKRHGLAIAWKPMPVRQVFAETGGLPLPQRHPARQRYRLVELQRWRAKRGLPLVAQPRHVPFDATLADGVAIAAVAAGHDPEAFLRLAHAAIWAQQRDLGDEATIRDLAEAAGLPAAPLLAEAAGEAVAARYRAHRDEAIAAGVFGVPAYVLEGEIFWGQDRLELLAEALAQGRPPYRPDGA